MANGSVRIDVDTSGASQNVRKLVDDFNKLPKPLNTASKDLSEVVNSAKDAGRSLVSASKDSVALAGALGKVATGAKSPRQELSQLKGALEEATVAYNRLSDQEKAGDFGKALKRSIDEIAGKARELKGSINEANRSLQDHKEKAEGSGGALDALEKKLGMNISTFTKFASVGAAVSTALKVAKDAFLQNESGIDEWGRTVEGAKGAYNTFLDTINGGNWSNFFTNLDNAIKGSRDLYDALDRLGSVKANNQAAIAIAQAEIQRLRVLKQQGQDVDAQLKQAEARLKSLQGQSVDAGKAAGRKQITEVIRRRYASQEGAAVNGLSQDSLTRITNSIINRGQKYFDEQKRIYEQLKEKGTVTKTTRRTSETGQTYEFSKTVFDMKSLSRQDQIAFRIAKAVTEGETELQKGVTTFAQAVNEQAQSFREEFRNNRIINQKTGGSGGKDRKTEPVFDASADSLKGMRDNISVLTKQLDTMKVGTEAYNKVLKDRIEWETKLKNQQQYNTDITTFYSGKRAQGAKMFETSKTSDLFQSMSHDEAKKGLQPIKLPKELTKQPKKEKKDRAEALKGLVGGVENITSGLEGLGVDVGSGFKKGLKLVQSIITIVEGIKAIESAVQILTTGRDSVFQATVVGELGAIATSTAVTAATSTLKAVPIIGWLLKQGGVVHAAGGVVMGQNYIDRVPASLSSGEMVLNPAQQTKLFKMANSGGGGGQESAPYVNAETIVLGIQNWAKRRGKGSELVFTSR